MAQQVKTWSEKLRDKRWQQLRLKVMNRDGWKCRICRHDDRTLNVHHVVYSRHNQNPWDYDEAVLQTLCEDCHRDRQDLIDNAANAVKIALMDVPTKRVEKFVQRLCKEAMEDL
jgi:5-methylcytosine-specific restriction endonuclease McrA